MDEIEKRVAELKEKREAGERVLKEFGESFGEPVVDNPKERTNETVFALRDEARKLRALAAGHEIARKDAEGKAFQLDELADVLTRTVEHYPTVVIDCRVRLNEVEVLG